MSEKAYDVALGVLRGFTMGEEVGSQALAVIESQNQALQEALRNIVTAWISDTATTDDVKDAINDAIELLSPTQETDPE